MHIHISPKQGFFNLRLGEVWRYKDLIRLFTRKHFTVKYKQTILGPLWIFLNPILTGFVFTMLFGKIGGFSTDGVPQVLFYLTSTTVWQFFAACLTTNSGLFHNNAGLFGKVYFPRLTVPISNVFSSLLQFLIQMIPIAGLLIYYTIRGAVHPSLAVMPLVIPAVIQLGILGLGFGVIISSLTTKYRDLSVLVSFGVSLWMFVTPVVYPLSQISDGLMKKLMMLNPATMPIEMFRHALLNTASVKWEYAIISWCVTLFVTYFGILIFNRVERTFADTI